MRAIKQKFSLTTAGTQSPSFSRGLDTSPPFFSKGYLVRGYDLGALALEYNASFPITAYVDFLFCPVSAYIRHVEGVQPPPGPNVQIGIITHKAYQTLLLKEFNIVKWYHFDDCGAEMGERFKEAVEDIVENARSAILKALDHGSEADSAVLELKFAFTRWISKKSQNISSFAGKTRLEGVELAKEYVPNRRFEVLFRASEIGISGGKIDVIEGGLPVEVKSKEGLWARSSGAHNLQVALQALLLEAATYRAVDNARIIYFYDIQQRLVPIDGRLRNWALDVRDRALDVLTKEKPPKMFRCRRKCTFAKHCMLSDSKHHIESVLMQDHLDPPKLGGIS